MRIKIVNKHHGHQPDGDRRIYIGRGSPLGNPFPITKTDPRDAVIDRYKPWLETQIGKNSSTVIAALNHIAGRASDGGVDLVCYCAPARCHGEVIRDIILEKAREQTSNLCGHRQS